MKIIYQNPTSDSASGTRSAQEIQKPGRSDAGTSASEKSWAGGDKVEFSSALASLSRAMESYSSSPNSQVEALAAEYQSGIYKVDSAAVSRGMISEALGG